MTDASEKQKHQDEEDGPLTIVLFSLHWVEYLIELANAFAERGHRVGVVFAAGRVANTVGGELPALLDPRVEHIEVTDYPKGLRDPRQLLTASRILRFVQRMRPDVLHVQDSTNGVVALCLPFWKKTPLVLTVHDVTTHPGHDSGGPGRRETVREALRTRADAVVVHGEKLKRLYLGKYPAAANQVHCVPHGCYQLFRHWADPSLRREPKTILFFGRIELYKGLRHLIDAFREVRTACPDAKLIIAGGGGDLDTHISTLRNLPGCELHAGYVPTERVAQLFQRATVAVLPYTEGSQSGVTRIAYPFGTPVIVTDVGSIAESVVPDRSGIVVAPGDTHALTTALLAVLTDEALAGRLSRGAEEMAAETMSWAQVAKKQECLLRGLIGDPRAGDTRSVSSTAERSTA